MNKCNDNSRKMIWKRRETPRAKPIPGDQENQWFSYCPEIRKTQYIEHATARLTAGCST